MLIYDVIMKKGDNKNEINVRKGNEGWNKACEENESNNRWLSWPLCGKNLSTKPRKTCYILWPLLKIENKCFTNGSRLLMENQLARDEPLLIEEKKKLFKCSYKAASSANWHAIPCIWADCMYVFLIMCSWFFATTTSWRCILIGLSIGNTNNKTAETRLAKPLTCIVWVMGVASWL